MIKLYNLKMNYTGQDRLFYQTVAERDLDFSLGFTEYSSTNFKRESDLEFKIDVYATYEQVSLFNYAIYKGYHCFVDSIVEKVVGKQCTVILKLDVINQYLIGDNIDTSKEVFVHRTHLDRFKEVDTDVYEYNFNDDDLLIKEDLQIEPSIYGDNNFSLAEQAGQTIKWLTITKTVAEAQTGSPIIADRTFNQFKDDGIVYNDNIRMPNVTYFVPLIYNDVEFRYLGNPIGSCDIKKVMDYATTSDILDVEVMPYMPNDIVGTVEVDHTTKVVTVNVILLNREAGNGTVQKINSSDADSFMLTNNVFGKFADLEVCSEFGVGDENAHKPIFSLTEISSNEDLEPKLFQYKKYDISFLQNKFDAYFDQLKNDSIAVKLQAGLDYGTSRFDFYLESGNYNNFKNTGGIITAIADNTVAMNLDQWKDYVKQKKTSSSAGYAYGQQIAGTAFGVGANLFTGNSLGAVAQGAGGVGNILNTYAQRQDLKQAPNQVKARGGNILNDFPYCATFYLTMSEVNPTETEKKLILNRLIYNGYLLNDYRNLKDIIDTREKFNYIQLLNDDNVLNVGVSERVNQELIRLLNNGVRLYKSISILSAKPKINLERSL